MKPKRLSVALVVLLACAPTSPADKRTDLELGVLAERCDRDLRAATAPIYRRYRAALEPLLRKATADGDLELAVRIKVLLDAIPLDEGLAKPKPRNADELKDYLDATTWTIRYEKTPNKDDSTLTFSKKGIVKHSNGEEGALKFLGPRKIFLWNYDPAEFNEDFTEFRAKGAFGIYVGKRVP